MGLAFCSCSGTLATATFDNVSVTSGTMPLVSGVTPTFGTIGTSVTISGSHFGSSQGANTVNFNGASASSISSWSDSQIVAAVPANASSGPVSVVVNSIESNTDVGFTFYHPVIASVSPSTAQPGARVIVTGSGFGQYQLVGFALLFNGVAASIDSPGYGLEYWSDTQIIAFVPWTTSGPVTVTLQGISSNAVQFNVETLTVASLSPNFGPAGSPITITGTGFGPLQTSSTVDFYGTSAAVQSWSDTQIVAIVPPGAASGSVNVTVGGIINYGPTFTMTQTFQLTDSKGNQSSYTSAMIGGLWVPTVGQGSGCSTCTQRGNISYIFSSVRGSSLRYGRGQELRERRRRKSFSWARCC
jgi:IPT/TIG domain